MFSYEKENGITRPLESNKGLCMYSLPSLNNIKLGRVFDVTDEMMLFLTASLGYLETSILPNFRLLVAYLVPSMDLTLVVNIYRMRIRC